jgi:hypothetical protein
VRRITSSEHAPSSASSAASATSLHARDHAFPVGAHADRIANSAGQAGSGPCRREASLEVGGVHRRAVHLVYRPPIVRPSATITWVLARASWVRMVVVNASQGRWMRTVSSRRIS